MTERDVNESVTHEQLRAEAKEKIAHFRREMAGLLEIGTKTEVYNLNIQLVPVSYPLTSKEKKK